MRVLTQTSTAGVSIVEVVLSLAIMSVTLGTLINAYVQSARRIEWTAYALAAEGLAIQRAEQAKAANWNVLTTPVTDELVVSNFPPVVGVLDVPNAGGNLSLATNTLSITTISTNPHFRLVRSDTVWALRSKGSKGPFTNSIVTLVSPY